MDVPHHSWLLHSAQYGLGFYFQPMLLSLTFELLIVTEADVYGKIIQLTVVARRSRLFAGARFLKRGINEQGNCANDVETEQIVCEPNMGALSDSRFTSFVQHRGSIPLYWAQLNAGVMPKPPIISTHDL